MGSRSFLRRVVAPLAALALTSPAVIALTATAAAAAPALLPFTVTNHSGRADATYIYVIARNATTGAQGYVDSGGTWHAYSFPSSIPNGPVAAPDVSIPGPGNGASKTITLAPNLSGGRIYFAMGEKLHFFLTTNGLVEPAPWVSSDPNANVLYDWTEFARTSNGGNGIFINSTTVDMFSLPVTVSVTSTSGSTQTRGIPGNRQGILNAFGALGSPWSSLQTTRSSDGLPLRVLAPVHGIANGVFSSTYLDSYISAVWSYYASHTLTVQTSLGNFTGTTSGNNWTFHSSSGATIGTLTKPNTSDTFACAGGVQPPGQPDETAILAVGARVCAALNRATLSTSSRVMSNTIPTSDPTRFYQQSASNLFSKTIHDNSLDGLAYGFSYDDVGGFAPTIDQPDPQSGGMTIGSFGTDGGTGGGGGGTGGGGSGGGGGATAGASGPVASGIAGKCMDVSGANPASGTHVQLWDCNNTTAQTWTQYSDDTLRALGKCLDATGNGTANGTKLEIWDCNGGGAQVWQPYNGGYRNPQSGRCVDDPSSSTTNGTQLQLWDCNGSNAQKWSIPGQGSTGGGGGGGGTITGSTIIGPGGKCIDVAGDDTGGNGAAVQLWDCQSFAVDQHWTYTNNTLQTLGRCMDVTGNGTANGTKIQLWDCNGGGAQAWVRGSNGSLVNPQSGRCLDDPSGSTANGARLQIWDCNGSAAQNWTSSLFPAGGGGGGTGGTSATSTIQAESYASQSGTQTETCSDTGGGQDVGWIGNGDWLQFNNVNFGSTPLSTFSARVASGAAAGVSGLVEVHLDSLTNPSIGSFAIGNTGGWQSWQTVPAGISGTTGTHTVYLKFTTGSGQDFVNINWLTFS